MNQCGYCGKNTSFLRRRFFARQWFCDGDCLASWIDNNPERAGGAADVVVAETVLWKGSGSYLGGHPLFIKRDKSGGQIRLTYGALIYDGRAHFQIPATSMVDARLGTFQPGTIRRVLVHDSRILADVRNSLLLDFVYDDTQYRVEFHIMGALTVPGEAENARDLLNALNALRPLFRVAGQAMSGVDTGRLRSPGERLRELKSLMEEGVISEEEFQTKKAELLRDL